MVVTVGGKTPSLQRQCVRRGKLGKAGEATKRRQHHRPKKGVEKYHAGEDSEAFHETMVRADNYTGL